jgi:hypothetical protein
MQSPVGEEEAPAESIEGLSPTAPTSFSAGEAQGQGSRTDSPATKPSGESMPADPVLGSLGEGVSANLAPSVPVVEPPSRVRRRMDIDQLSASILRVTGGLEWKVGNNEQFTVLATTLGKPDFVELTQEDLEPSALFQKFLDDAARSVCFELVEQELLKAADERVLLKHVGPEDTLAEMPEAVLQNLQYLLLRYHGRNLSPDSQQLEHWRWLYETAEAVSGAPLMAWRTVCVGLIVHPHFYTY